MKKRHIFIILFFIINIFQIHTLTYAQEDNSFDVKGMTLDLDLKYKHLYLDRNTENYKFRIDPKLNNRKQDSLDYSSPFQHSALYIKTGFNVNYKDKYKLDFNTFLEQRSWSKGVNNLNRYVVFPQFRFNLADTIKLKHHKLKWKVKLGDLYTDDELTSGLRAYNIDVLGYNAHLKYRKSKLSLFFSADMSAAIGLNMDDYYYLRYSRYFDKDMKVGALVSRTNSYYNPDFKWQYNYGIFIQKKIPIGPQFVLMVDYADKKMSFIKERYSNFAGLIKVSYDKKFDNTKLNAEGNIRYFGVDYASFYYDYFGANYLYRSEQNREERGKYLYPLKNYFRPVSQFALYSEYFAKQILTYEFNVNWEQKLFYKFDQELDVEILNLNTKRCNSRKTNYSSFTYYYYTYFLHYNVFPGFKAGLYFSNKLMNVDVKYQTFYQSNKPFYGIHFTWDGNFNLKK